MKKEIIDIINENYDSENDILNKEAIADQVIELVEWKRTYEIGKVNNPFNTLIEFEER